MIFLLLSFVGVFLIYIWSQIFMGLIYASLIEYFAHWLILHKLGAKKDSFFAHHWHGHHRASRKNLFRDNSYLSGFLAWNKHGREFASVLLLIVVNTLLFMHIAPIFAITADYYALSYLYYHRKMHLNPGWGRAKFPHHYDHHMGLSQNKNWGVLTDFWDLLFGTRVKYSYDKNGKAIGHRV